MRGFKFSQQSTDIFKLLWRLASARDGEKYTKCLPENLSNKIWQPIILSRTPRSLWATVGAQLQKLANDEMPEKDKIEGKKSLLMSIFMSNISNTKDAEPKIKLLIKPPPRSVRDTRAVTEIFTQVEQEKPRERVGQLTRQSSFFMVLAARRKGTGLKVEPIDAKAESANVHVLESTL